MRRRSPKQERTDPEGAGISRRTAGKSGWTEGFIRSFSLKLPRICGTFESWGQRSARMGSGDRFDVMIRMTGNAFGVHFHMKKTLFWINLIAGGLLLVAAFLALVLPYRFTGSTYKDTLDARKGWFYVDQNGQITSEEADIHDPVFDENRRAVAACTVDAAGLVGGDLCFISTNINFKLYMDDELIYDFEPELKWYSGSSYGNMVHEVNLPYFKGRATLRLEMERTEDGMWSGFDRVYFQNSAQYIKDLLDDYFSKLVISFIIFLIGALLVVLALVFEFRTAQQTEAISIGLVAMILAIWSNSGTYMLEMFASDLGLVRMLTYTTLILLPFPGLTLILCVVRNLKSKSAWIVGSLVVANLLTHFIVIVTKLGDYHDLLLFTHGVFILTVALAVIEVVRGIRKKRLATKEQFVVLGTFSIVVVTGMVDLVTFYMGNRMDVARFTRVGLLFFIVFLSIHEIGQLIEISRKSSEAEIMNRLAHEDGLTGLENRLAFTEYERELSMRSDGRCLIIQMDINFLKKVNDGYGHVEGDKIICGAARVISGSFGEYGRVFRTGGDEFISVIEGNETKKLLDTYETGRQKLAKLIEEFNQTEQPVVPLSIAYGMAEYVYGSGNPEKQERLADSRMYEHKKCLKEMAQNTQDK